MKSFWLITNKTTILDDGDLDLDTHLGPIYCLGSGGLDFGQGILWWNEVEGVIFSDREDLRRQFFWGRFWARQFLWATFWGLEEERAEKLEVECATWELINQPEPQLWRPLDFMIGDKCLGSVGTDGAGREREGQLWSLFTRLQNFKGRRVKKIADGADVLWNWRSETTRRQDKDAPKTDEGVINQDNGRRGRKGKRHLGQSGPRVGPFVSTRKQERHSSK